MIKKLQHIFALSEQGAKDLVKSTLWTVICNISLMLPIGVIMATIQHLLRSVTDGVNPMANFWLYTGSAVLILAVLFILHYFQYAALYNATYIESANRRIGLAETLRKLPLSFFGKRDLSDLTATMIADCSHLDQMFSHYVPTLIAACISTTLIAVMLFIADWRMALAILWVVPVALALAVGSKKLQDTFGHRCIEKKRVVTDSIQECLETIRDIKADNLEDSYLEEFDEKTKAAENGCIQSELATGSFISSAQAFLRVGLATTVLVGIAQVTSGRLDFLFFLGFLFAAVRIYDPISVTLQNIAATFNAKQYIERMRAIQEEPVQTGMESFSPKEFDIVFDHVDFAYHGDDEGVLKDVSFTAKQGEVTALVGPSGGGKSTATKLAARFWDVGAGKITLGGVDVSTVDPEALLKYYAIVFQDVVLFRDSIIENIRLGRRDATDEEVQAAAKAARCDEFIQKLPDRFQTIIGENGATLSGGERQRISIARALLKNAPIVLLDEATASLDVENESAVQAALSHLLQGKTVLIIAHRMRTVAGADKIVVLEEGHVAEQGAPNVLLESGKAFRHMVELQQQSAAWTLD
ncbi:MAG: ABC transporter ATP-binding protein [Oscillospiraceae bacterium]